MKKILYLFIILSTVSWGKLSRDNWGDNWDSGEEIIILKGNMIRFLMLFMVILNVKL